MRLCLTALAACLAACRPPAPGRSPDPSSPDDGRPATVECRVPAEALAWVPGDPCGVVLVGGESPRIVHGEGTAPIPVELPGACVESGCDFELVRTPLGILVVAAGRSAASETPSWVGLGVDLGDGYRFLDLWIGAGVLTELTPSGPVHTLAPYDCQGKLALFVEPRLGGARDEPPEPALLAGEGEVRREGAEFVMHAIEPEGCAPLRLELP